LLYNLAGWGKIKKDFNGIMINFSPVAHSKSLWIPAHLFPQILVYLNYLTVKGFSIHKNL